MELLEFFSGMILIGTVLLVYMSGRLLDKLDKMKKEKPFTEEDLERFVTHLEVMLRHKEVTAKRDLLSQIMKSKRKTDHISEIDLQEGSLGVYMSPELKESMELKDEAYWRIEFSGEGERLEGEGPGGQYTSDQRKAYDEDPNVFYCSLEEALEIAKKRQDGGLRGKG